MASDADDDAEVLLLQGHAFLLLAALRRRIQRKKRKKHRFWVRAIFKERRRYGAYHTLVQELRMFDREFFFR